MPRRRCAESFGVARQYSRERIAVVGQALPREHFEANGPDRPYVHAHAAPRGGNPTVLQARATGVRERVGHVHPVPFASDEALGRRVDQGSWNEGRRCERAFFIALGAYWLRVRAGAPSAVQSIY